MLLGTQHDHRFRVQFDGGAVGTFINHFRAERSSDHGTVGRNTFATFTAERLGSVHGQFQIRCRLRQVGGFERRVFQLLGRLNEALLDLSRFQFAGQLVFQAGQGRHFRRFHAQQLDQVITEVGTNRLGHLVFRQ